MGIQEKWKKVGKFPESGDIIRMEYFRKNPEKESLTGGCLGEERMMKFYRCKKCGKAVAVLGESGEDMFCRNAEIEELIPNTTDAAGEKHVPVITKDGSKVHVASRRCRASHAGKPLYHLDCSGNEERKPAGGFETGHETGG